jgi:hypothetical protein
MHTVDLLEQACEIAEQLGYRTRHEWLGGSGGGACEFAGKKWIFVDLALSVFEQLEQVTEALRRDPGIYLIDLSPPMRQVLGIRNAA